MNTVDALVLKNLKGVGDGSVTKLLLFAEKHGISSLEQLASTSIQGLPLRKVPESLKKLLASGDFEGMRRKSRDDIRDWDVMNVAVVSLNSKAYPNQLLDLKDPPPFLFCKGNSSLLNSTRTIAVVGTRKNSSKGSLIATKTVEAFHSRNFIIVSGLAIGIDSIAHRASLDCGAPTIAVLVDVLKISPSTNKGLAEEIINNDGLLIAENKPGTTPIAAFYAKRDRIQSGLSAAVFAIETLKDGGTMNAVSAAEKMKRPVFVPDAVAAKYDLTLDVIQGTQYLIDEKRARAYTSELYEGIFKELERVAEDMLIRKTS